MSRIDYLWPVLLAGLSLGVAGCTSTPQTAEPRAPRAAELEACHGYNCYFRTKVTISAKDARVIAGYFRKARTPEAERAAMARAVQHFEKRTTQTIGIADDAKSAFFGSAERGQLDCLDEAENTRALLAYLADSGLLKHHTVGGKVSRGLLIDERYFHTTATVRDSAGRGWAVDSWFEAAGRPPQIMPLEDWKKSGQFSELWDEG